jgi:hypothetical protein
MSDKRETLGATPPRDEEVRKLWERAYFHMVVKCDTCSRLLEPTNVAHDVDRHTGHRVTTVFVKPCEEGDRMTKGSSRLKRELLELAEALEEYTVVAELRDHHLAVPKTLAAGVQRLAGEHEGWDQQLLGYAALALAEEWVGRSYLATKCAALQERIEELELGAVELQVLVGRRAREEEDDG